MPSRPHLAGMFASRFGNLAQRVNFALKHLVVAYLLSVGTPTPYKVI